MSKTIRRFDGYNVYTFPTQSQNKYMLYILFCPDTEQMQERFVGRNERRCLPMMFGYHKPAQTTQHQAKKLVARKNWGQLQEDSLDYYNEYAQFKERNFGFLKSIEEILNGRKPSYILPLEEEEMHDLQETDVSSMGCHNSRSWYWEHLITKETRTVYNEMNEARIGVCFVPFGDQFYFWYRSNGQHIYVVDNFNTLTKLVGIIICIRENDSDCTCDKFCFPGEIARSCLRAGVPPIDEAEFIGLLRSYLRV